jgi:hypothetical protein
MHQPAALLIQRKRFPPYKVAFTPVFRTDGRAVASHTPFA